MINISTEFNKKVHSYRQKLKKRFKIIFSFLSGIILLAFYIYTISIPISVNQNISPFNGKDFRIAHRCGKKFFPENTLFACKQISKLDLADILEMDVRLTKDNHLIVIHDESVDRTTNGFGKVTELTYDEIKSLDAGFQFTENKLDFPFRGIGIQILELEEFFKNLPEAKYYIEVKVTDPLASVTLIQLIQKYKLENSVFIGSVNDSVNANLRKLCDGKIQVISGFKETIFWYFSYLLGVRGIANPPEVMVIPHLPKLMPINEAFLNAIKEQKIRIHIFTINEKELIEKFRSLGLNGVMTDNPHLFSK